jgi:hypothetical protein
VPCYCSSEVEKLRLLAATSHSPPPTPLLPSTILSRPTYRQQQGQVPTCQNEKCDTRLATTKSRKYVRTIWWSLAWCRISHFGAKWQVGTRPYCPCTTASRQLLLISLPPTSSRPSYPRQRAVSSLNLKPPSWKTDQTLSRPHFLHANIGFLPSDFYELISYPSLSRLPG